MTLKISSSALQNSPLRTRQQCSRMPRSNYKRGLATKLSVKTGPPRDQDSGFTGSEDREQPPAPPGHQTHYEDHLVISPRTYSVCQNLPWVLQMLGPPDRVRHMFTPPYTHNHPPHLLYYRHSN
jgi:hypothetical protein